MATQVQFRRGTTAETAAFTGAVGEVTVDTSKRVPVVHDGSTAGGFPALRENGVNSSLATGSLASPALKFANSTNTGIYSPGTGTIALVASGIAALSTDTVGNLTTPGLFTASGRITGTAFVPTGSTVPTDGLYLSAANTVSIATNSGARLTVGPTGDVTITGGLSIGSSFSAASFVPTGSSIPTNGMYLSAANEVSIATNGVQRFTISSTGAVTITGAFNFTGSYIADAFIPTSAIIPVNGMYLPSANTLGFATNTTQRLTIDSSGNVTVATGSINTSSGTNTAQSFIPTSSTIPTNGLYLPSANTVALATNSAQRLTVDSTGNVTANTGSLTVSAGTATAQSFIPTSATIPANGMYLSAANTLAFATNTTARLTIGSTGNVTISGTGTLTVPGTTTAASFIPTSSTVPTNGLYLSAANTLAFSTNSGAKMSLDATGNLTVSSGSITTSSGSNTAQSFIPSSATVPSNGLYLPAANTVGLATNTAERVRIDGSGLVTLASTVPAVRLTGSTSGYVEIAAPATAGSNRLVLPNGNGSANQVLTTDGSGVLSWSAAGSITTVAAVSTNTATTTVSLTTTAPSSAKVISVIFNAVSVSAASALLIQLGTTGGIQTTGYNSQSNEFSNNGVGADTSTAGMVLRNSSSSYQFSGEVRLVNITGNTWIASGVLCTTATSPVIYTLTIAGQVSLSGTLTQIRLNTAGGTATFDNGSAALFYYS